MLKHLRDTDNEEEISRLVEFLREVRRELKKISSTILH
jgi:preprotein translocase subunit SecE